jgi:hypothetical protein
MDQNDPDEAVFSGSVDVTIPAKELGHIYQYEEEWQNE